MYKNFKNRTLMLQNLQTFNKLIYKWSVDRWWTNLEMVVLFNVHAKHHLQVSLLKVKYQRAEQVLNSCMMTHPPFDRTDWPTCCQCRR